MELSRGDLMAYDAELSRVEGAAAEWVRRRVSAYLDAYPQASVAEAREFAKAVVGEAVDSYGDAASEAAAGLYDSLAEAAGRDLPAAAVDDSDVSSYVDDAVRYQARKLAHGAPSAFAEGCAACASDQVSRRANATMMANVGRDGVRYARVPLGVETCDFCVMLASRGFVYHTRAAAGEMSHWHRNCRCKVIPGIADDFTVEGYSGEQYEAIARAHAEIDADGTLTPEQRQSAKAALQEYDATEYYAAYRESGVAGRVKASGARRRARRNDALFASAEGDPEKLARYVAGARSESDLMYRTARAVGDMAARRDWASVAALRDVAESTRRGLAAGSDAPAGNGGVPPAFALRFISRSDDLYQNAGRIEPIDGFEDICIHSDGLGFYYKPSGGEAYQSLSVRELGEGLRSSSDYHGGPIRLIACDSGFGGDCAAQFLANEMGVDVLAPTQTVYVEPDGRMILARNDGEYEKVRDGIIGSTGKWVVFRPEVAP